MHPAVTVPFSELVLGLSEWESKGYIKSQTNNDLTLYTYSESATYEKQWNLFTLSARGLILDLNEKKIVALPFPKFFNYSETNGSLPQAPFEIQEKLDGSLIILFNHNGSWKTATKGSFSSSQAKYSLSLLSPIQLKKLNPEITYLFELIGPSNKIVVPYSEDKLVLLAALERDTGEELFSSNLRALSQEIKIDLVKKFPYSSIEELVKTAENLPADKEGFVTRFSTGLRLKIKGKEYLRIHKLLSSLTPISVWEMMKDSSGQLSGIRKELPEEFWQDFDTIHRLLTISLQEIISEVENFYEKTRELSDKELGLQLSSLPENIRRFIFPYRKHGSLLEGKTREAIYRAVRPDSNILSGYSVNRALDELRA